MGTIFLRLVPAVLTRGSSSAARGRRCGGERIGSSRLKIDGLLGVIPHLLLLLLLVLVLPEVKCTRTITIGEIMTVDFAGKIEAGGGGE